MNQMTYGFSKRKLQKAILCLHEAPTVYEGLHDAFLHELRWIDPERDMPRNLRSLTHGILNDFGFGEAGGAPRTRQKHGLRAAMQRLDLPEAENLAARLVSLMELLAADSKEGRAPRTVDLRPKLIH